MSIRATLIQDRLDVTAKFRANLFNWRGQFTPQFVDYVLDAFAQPGCTVIDPFSGSGTVLQECLMKRMNCYGFEINPAAYAQSSFFTLANLPVAERQKLFSGFQKKFLDLMPQVWEIPLLRDSTQFRERYFNLLEFAKKLCAAVSTRRERILAVNLLFVAENRARKELDSTLLQAIDYLRKAALSLPLTEEAIEAGLSDARLTHQRCPEKADLIFTSPPYINVFNYHQNHRAILETFGWNMLKVAQSEIGSNRKNRGNRFRTVAQYCLDMEQSLISFWQCLKPCAMMVIVVGRESNVRRVPFYNGAIIKDIMIAAGGFEEITNHERKFINRFGVRIREDIIVCRKSDDPPVANQARTVALRHLEQGLERASVETQNDIREVIERLDEIQSSPLMTVEDLFCDASNAS